MKQSCGNAGNNKPETRDEKCPHRAYRGLETTEGRIGGLENQPIRITHTNINLTGVPEEESERIEEKCSDDSQTFSKTNDKIQGRDSRKKKQTKP